MLQITFIPKASFPVVSWDRERQTLFADASDIRYAGERVIRVKSKETGRTEDFVYLQDRRNREGELMDTVFSGPRGMKFVVFND